MDETPDELAKLRADFEHQHNNLTVALTVMKIMAQQIDRMLEVIESLSERVQTLERPKEPY